MSLDKSVKVKTIFHISQPKHMLWVLNETVHLSTQNTFVNGWIKKKTQFFAIKNMLFNK